MTEASVDLDHPEVVFIKRLDGTGYGFFYSTPAQFQNAADGFMFPITARIEKEAEGQDPPVSSLDAPKIRLKAAMTTVVKVFEPDWNDQEGLDAARCVAASCAMETPWQNKSMPQAVVIEQIGDEILVRDGIEFMSHPGYPLSVVIGSKGDGGGLCTFYDSPEEYLQMAKKAPTENTWMPQLIYRLYRITPSIMTGFPKPSENGNGVGVECHAYNLNRKGQLIERG